MVGDLLDQIGAEEGKFLAGNHEKGLNRIVKVTVHQTHLQFKLKIGNRSQPFNNDGRLI